MRSAGTSKPLRGFAAPAHGVNCTEAAMYDSDVPSDLGLIALVPKVLILGYFLYGASVGETQLPGGRLSPDIFLNGTRAWMACLFPSFWIAGDIVWYTDVVGSNVEHRRVIARVFVVAGFVFLLLALVM
ncbi:MAG: hypothetical protein AAFY26_24825 [Cyanobacteria bacterium J06638_22]